MGRCFAAAEGGLSGGGGQPRGWRRCSTRVATRVTGARGSALRAFQGSVDRGRGNRLVVLTSPAVVVWGAGATRPLTTEVSRGDDRA